MSGFGRQLRERAGRQQDPTEDELDRLRSLRMWTLLYMLNRLKVVQPVSRQDGISVAQLASTFSTFSNGGLIPE